MITNVNTCIVLKTTFATNNVAVAAVCRLDLRRDLWMVLGTLKKINLKRGLIFS